MEINLITLCDLASSMARHYPYSPAEVYQEACKIKDSYQRIEDLEPALARRLQKRMVCGY